MFAPSKLFAPLAAFVILVGAASADDDKKADKPAFLGIAINPPEEGAKGLVVREVQPDGPAAKAGLKADDVILKIDDKEIKDPMVFVTAVRAHKAGDVIKLTIKRGDEEKVIKITAGVRPEE